MTARQIVATVAAKHSMEPTDLMKGKPSSARIFRARDEAMAALRKDLGWSYTRIGHYFGFHYTSVMSAIARAAAPISQTKRARPRTVADVGEYLVAVEVELSARIRRIEEMQAHLMGVL